MDLEERGAEYGLTQGATSQSTSSATVADRAAGMTPATRPETETDSTLQLSEENLSVGKRVVNRGGTRIRRYVIETPVEQSVTLRSEKVTLDRRPVTDARPVTNPDFTEKTIEMTETEEQAVVSKTARVVEEVSLRKQATERVETVSDKVRREEVAVEQAPGGTAAARPGVPPVSPKI